MQKPPQTIQVKAIRPERDAQEIRFPRIAGYRVYLPNERLRANFNNDSILELNPDIVGPSITKNSGIIGQVHPGQGSTVGDERWRCIRIS